MSKFRLPFNSPLSTWGTIIAGVVALVIVCLVVWWIFIRPGQLAQNAAQSKLEGNVATGRMDSAQEANTIVEGLNKEEKEYDHITEQGNQAIREAAANPDPRAGNCAAIRASCMQRSYRDSAYCTRVLESCSKLGY